MKDFRVTTIDLVSNCFTILKETIFDHITRKKYVYIGNFIARLMYFYGCICVGEPTSNL